MLLISKNYWMGFPFNFLGDIPGEVQQEPVFLKSQDMRESSGIFYQPPAHRRQDIGVLIMHPKVDFRRHYSIPGFLAAGISCLGLNTRCFNNDMAAVHEELLLDVAAGVKFLKETRGLRQVVLLGNSGGGALSTYYQAQAILPPEQRVAKTPAGDPTKLARSELIPADALILVSAHRGEGLVLQECIDPAVVDEANPSLSCRELDMYHPENGFAPPPEPSRYEPAFVQQYRGAQIERVKRLDAMAQAMVDEARFHETRYGESKGQLAFGERQIHGRLGALERIMVIYRTMANLHYTDPSLDPSPRGYGSLLSERPDLMNMQSLGFGRVCRPEAWLSTWSGQRSYATLDRHLPTITDQPVYLAYAEKDKEIYPRTDAEPIRQMLSSKDSTSCNYAAEHYFEPEFGASQAPDVDRLMADLVPWVLERFGT